MKIKFLKIFSITLLLIVLLGLLHVVNADMGPKPSITIHLKNMKTNNYIIDLFEYAEKNENYYPDSNYSNNDRMNQFIETDGTKDKNGILVYFNDIAKSRRNNS